MLIKEKIPLCYNIVDQKNYNRRYFIYGQRIHINGGMERANRDVKTIIRHAYGFTNFPRLRNRIMYVKNDDATILYYRKENQKKKVC